MKTMTLDDITQEDFDNAAQIVISGIKAYNRKLDTRTGTVLRDLLVDPEAAIESVTSRQIDEERKTSSLKRLKEAQDAGETIDQEDVDSILSNFNIKPASGLKAKGTVKIVVSDNSIAYAVAEGAVFRTIDGLEFTADASVVASSFELDTATISEQIKLYEGAAGFFFLVPVTAVETGSQGNIQQGTSLTPDTSITSFVMAEAYKDFDGGSDTPSLESIINDIPSGLSIRGFVNKNAVEGMLRDEFDQGDYPMVAVSTVGYGNIAQRRDKHNVLGIGVGGRIDVYVRNFNDIFTVTKIVKAVKGDKEGEYRISVSPDIFPGACWIKSVSDTYTGVSGVGSEEESVVGSFAFDVKRTADLSNTWHDIDVSSNPSEAFNTVWQGFDISLHDVPAISDNSEESGESGQLEREFKVTAYCLPQAADIQAYVDREDIRNVATDVVVRCPIICNVSVNAVVQYDPKKPIDDEAAKSRIRSYINELGFVGRLSRSEIVYILKNLGAVSVDMPYKDMLFGSLHDAFGVRHVLSGDALDISSIEDGKSMISKDTVIFAAESRNIQIKLIPNS